MPESEVSDRERLLRLIEGGPESVELDEARRRQSGSEPPGTPAAPVSPAPAAKKAQGPNWTEWRAKLFQSNADLAGSVKTILVLLVVLICFQLASGWIGRLLPSSKIQPSAPAGQDTSAGAGLRLVGVDWSEPPVALLEDIKTGKTYFAKKNDRIKDARVTQILKDQVTIFAQGRSEELR